MPIPVTAPVDEPTAKTPAPAVLLHVPPVTGLLNVVVAPMHRVVIPAMGARLFTVSVVVLIQPEVFAKVISVVPVETLATMPELLPIVATAVLLLIQVPKGELLNVVDAPAQTEVRPTIAVGSAFTVAAMLVRQVPPIEYVTFAVPAVSPFTIPVVDPTPTLPLPALPLQVPPVVALLSVVEAPAHSVLTPAIGGGPVLMVIVVVVMQPGGIE